VELLSSLVSLGLTEYEAKIYLALLKEYPANGYQLSKRTGVPRSMVYEALGRLHTRGAVLKSGDKRSTLYRPVPPDELLDRYDREHKQLIENLSERLLAIYEVEYEDSLWTVNERGAVFAYASQMIAKGKEEVYLVLDDLSLEELRDFILAASNRELQVGALLTGNGELECSQVSYHPPVESEMQGLEGMLIVVVDSQECLIANMMGDVEATITRNKNLVLIARQFIWMELFTQRINERLGSVMLDLLDETDRHILRSYSIEEQRIKSES
jgi:Cd2+/Zn2+-exporting ATPase